MSNKLLIFFVFFLIFNVSYSQTVPVNRNLAIDYRIRDFVVSKKLSNDSGEKILGSYFLFKDWKNNSKVTLTGKEFVLNNVNFNVQNNEFMSEIGTDSVFTVTPKHIDLISIGNRNFKYQFYKGENKFFEVLFTANKRLSFYKGFHIKILPKSEMGMLNRPYDEIRIEEKLYVLNGSALIEMKKKKKEFLNLFEKDLQNSMTKFIKEQKLSYKREQDLIEIFKYYDTI